MCDSEEVYLPGERAAGKRPVDWPSHLIEDPEEEINRSDYNYPHRSSQRGSSPSLFIPEEGDSDELTSPDGNLLDRLNDEIDFSISATGPSRSHYNAMEGLERARAIKREIERNISVLQPEAKQTEMFYNSQEDPENLLIKKLRDDQKMKWSDIAKQLNDARRERDEPADFTDQKIYGRYIQTNARIFLPIREIGFDPRDYNHLRIPQKDTQSGPFLNNISKNAKKRIKDPRNPVELKANLRQVVENDAATELETSEKTEQLLKAVAKVERNFWILVADEMERATTKLYDAGMLAERYHAI
ncbi:hypothetical protein J1614_006442 [Plenodomus biglobosus]|nr:hypothetical protein J1614_006442 [Plenodomus biglobosus]